MKLELHGCSEGHTPISFYAESDEQCPLCKALGDLEQLQCAFYELEQDHDDAKQELEEMRLERLGYPRLKAYETFD